VALGCGTAEAATAWALMGLEQGLEAVQVGQGKVEFG